MSPSILGANLDRLEALWWAHPARTPRRTYGSQFFAWDFDPAGEGTVVSIGANYGQHPTSAPHAITKANLRSWMRNYQHAANTIAGTWETQWRTHNWSAGGRPPLCPRYFVMTNVVPWITAKPWTLLPPKHAAAIVARASMIYRGKFLDDLVLLLPEAFVVGHGIDTRTLPHLPAAVGRWNNWMLYANLSYKKTPSCWSAAHSRFLF